MTQHLRIALAQINPTVGAIEANIERLRAARRKAAEDGADLLVASELVVCGYPPEDLVLKPAFLDHVAEAVSVLAAETSDGGPALLIGAPWLDHKRSSQVGLRARPHNAALLLDEGRVAAVRYKSILPNYGVFDEMRLFAPGQMREPLTFRGTRLGILVCEDMWTPEPAAELADAGAELLVVLNGSPFETEKHTTRLTLASQRAGATGLPLIYVNQVGGQDELVFDGASFVLMPDGKRPLTLPAWEETVVTTGWDRELGSGWQCHPGPQARVSEGLEAIWRAMMIGLHDYVSKNRFPGVVLGLSGGIDSALSAAVAVDALGAERVRCVMMPSPYTSRESLEDGEAVARLLGVAYDSVDIGPAMQAFESMLAPLFEGRPADITEENIQSRARGMTLMGISNKLGPMVLSTGNKSEMSVGYATLYGDMCGGYSVLKDVYKTTAFALARWRNEQRPPGALGPEGPVMPERVISKPPTAELRDNQKDEDSLPPYDRLDAILYALIEEEAGIDHIISRGHAQEEVLRVWRLLELAEYKRRQAPPGVKITPRNLSRDRRYPITNAFKGP